MLLLLDHGFQTGLETKENFVIFGGISIEDWKFFKPSKCFKVFRRI